VIYKGTRASDRLWEANFGGKFILYSGVNIMYVPGTWNLFPKMAHYSRNGNCSMCHHGGMMTP